jgi:hypothetical protein
MFIQPMRHTAASARVRALAGAQVLPDQRRRGVGHAPGRHQREHHDAYARSSPRPPPRSRRWPGCASGRSRPSSRRSSARSRPARCERSAAWSRHASAGWHARDAQMLTAAYQDPQLHQPRPRRARCWSRWPPPRRPCAGIGPRPKISIGSSTMFRAALASHSTRIAAAASPAPRKIGVDHEQQQDHRVATEHPLQVAIAVADGPTRRHPSGAAAPAPRRCRPRQRAPTPAPPARWPAPPTAQPPRPDARRRAGRRSR